VPYRLSTLHEKTSCLAGVRRYQQSGYVRPLCVFPVAWHSNNVRCVEVEENIMTPLDVDAPTVLLIPSLINRYYILDLTEELSLARALRRSGIRTYLLDWSEPTDDDAMMDSGDYVTRYLQPLLAWLHQKNGQPITVIGHCIGGLLALALTLLSPSQVKRLGLLATPWDFSHHPFPMKQWANASYMMGYGWEHEKASLFSGEYFSWLFYLADPVKFEEKYRYFLMLEEGSPAYERFIAVEHWVNDTVPLAKGVARNCLVDWARDNLTMQGGWRVQGEAINPANLQCPVFIAAPSHDRIVPCESARALAEVIPHGELIIPPSGHIGMIIGSKRNEVLLNPLIEWVKQ
jgi:polyhydroxyalkanoate synthase subunit PhaC